MKLIPTINEIGIVNEQRGVAPYMPPSREGEISSREKLTTALLPLTHQTRNSDVDESRIANGERRHVARVRQNAPFCTMLFDPYLRSHTTVYERCRLQTTSVALTERRNRLLA